ncbi:MAG: hypothetical protein ACXVXM_01240 [Nocardioidaceae bacterium]
MTGSPSKRTRRFAALAAAAALVLSGCGSVHPGSAAVVGARTIPDSRVDQVALALCSANASSGQTGQQSLPSRGARQGALSLLLRSAVSHAFGAAEHVHANAGQLSQALAQNSATINALPPARRAEFRSVVHDYAEGQLLVIAAGRRALARQGQTKITESQALTAGEKLRTRYAAGLKVEVDPRYGTYRKGNLHSTSGSLSVPVSAQAVAGRSSTPPATWVSSLPASQTCN